MARRDLFILSGSLILLTILIQLFKLILKFDIHILDSISMIAVGMGIAFLIVALFKKKKVIIDRIFLLSPLPDFSMEKIVDFWPYPKRAF